MFPFDRFSINPEDPDMRQAWSAFAQSLPLQPNCAAALAGDFNVADRVHVTRHVAFPLHSVADGRPTHRGRPFDDILSTPGLAPIGVGEVLELRSDHAMCLARFEARS